MSRRYPSTDVNRERKESKRVVQRFLQKRIAPILVRTSFPIFAQKFARKLCDEIWSKKSSQDWRKLPEYSFEIDAQRAQIDPWRAFWRPLGAQVSPTDAQKPPKSGQVELKRCLRAPKLSPRGAQEAPSYWLQVEPKKRPRGSK